MTVRRVRQVDRFVWTVLIGAVLAACAWMFFDGLRSWDFGWMAIGAGGAVAVAVVVGMWE